MFDFSQLNRLRHELNQAIVNNDLELFSRLVKAPDAKEDPNASEPRLHNLNYLDSDGQTPLHRTCHRGNLQFVKLLVENGANQHILNRDGWYPVHIASYYGHSEIAKYLLREENFADTPEIAVYEAPRPHRPTRIIHYISRSGSEDDSETSNQSSDDEESDEDDLSESSYESDEESEPECEGLEFSATAPELDPNSSLFKNLLDFDLKALEDLSLVDLV